MQFARRRDECNSRLQMCCLQSQVVVLAFKAACFHGPVQDRRDGRPAVFAGAVTTNDGKRRLVDETAQDDGDRLEYLVDMIAEMQRLAYAGNMPTLVYFLGMAHIEAQDLLRRPSGSGGREGNERYPVA